MPSPILLRIRLLCHFSCVPATCQREGGFERLFVRPPSLFPRCSIRRILAMCTSLELLFTYFISLGKSVSSNIRILIFSKSSLHSNFITDITKTSNSKRRHSELLLLPLLRDASHPQHARKRRRLCEGRMYRRTRLEEREAYLV
jgi:hypothetical protein